MTLRSPFTRTHYRVTAAAAVLACSSLMVLPALPSGVQPVASAEECSESYTKIDGAMTWGFKKSFLSYIKSGGTRGDWELDKVTFDEGTKEFTLTPKPNAMKVVDGDTATIPLEGSIRFFGHEGEGGQPAGEYALDFTLSDMKLVVDGTSATLVVDYKGLELEEGSVNVKGETSADDVEFMAINLNRAPDFASDSVEIPGAMTLTADGAKAFGGFYEAGQEFEDINLKANLEKVCGTQPTDSDISTSTGGGSNRGTKSIGIDGVNSVNDHLDALNNLMETADKFIATTDKVFAQFDKDRKELNSSDNSGGAKAGAGASGGTAAATGARSGTSAGAKPATKKTNVITGTPGGLGISSNAGGSGGAPASGASTGSAAGPATTGGAASAGSAGSNVCSDDGSYGVVESQAAWGVKKSFQTYVSGSIAKGGWDLDGVSHDNGQFLFAGNSGAVNPAAGSGSILMPGSIHFTGHGGILDLMISNIEIQWNGNTGVLNADVVSNDMDSNPINYGRVQMADLVFSQIDMTDTSVSGKTSSVTLTQAGASAFADFYPAGQEMAPLNFAATLGGSASCEAGQGAAASASAGTGGSGSAIARLSGSNSGGAGGSASKVGKTVGGKNTKKPSTSGFKAKNAGESKFKIRSSGQQSKSPETNNVADQKDTGSLTMPLLLILVACVVAGGTLTSFVSRNPAG